MSTIEQDSVALVIKWLIKVARHSQWATDLNLISFNTLFSCWCLHLNLTKGNGIYWDERQLSWWVQQVRSQGYGPFCGLWVWRREINRWPCWCWVNFSLFRINFYFEFRFWSFSVFNLILLLRYVQFCFQMHFWFRFEYHFNLIFYFVFNFKELVSRHWEISHLQVLDANQFSAELWYNSCYFLKVKVLSRNAKNIFVESSFLNLEMARRFLVHENIFSVHIQNRIAD